jgi:hypothetical protein
MSVMPARGRGTGPTLGYLGLFVQKARFNFHLVLRLLQKLGWKRSRATLLP